MSKVKLNFPRNFMWGTTSASHPFEGNSINNNWFAWEKSGHVINRQISGMACDWWGGRWREDFDRAYEAGQNAHRLSVEWSRIQPDPDRWDEEALDQYRQMLRGLLERGMTAIVTLHHFTEPLWISELGGWENEDILKHFKNYVRKTVEALKEYVSLWCTINEPNVLAIHAFMKDDFPPGKNNIAAVYKVFVNLIKGHAAAYQIIHELQSEAKVGLAHQYRGFRAASDYSPLDRWAANTTSQVFNNSIPNTLVYGTLRFLGTRKRIPAAKCTQDFFGLDYYTCERVSLNLRMPGQYFVNRFFPTQADLSPNNHIANEPVGFFQALSWAKEYKLPIIITGNGTEDPNGDFRPRYLVEHIKKLWHAVNFNWKIIGYFHWSLVDNFDWEFGWTKRFGLWELDNSTQERKKRTSVDLYQEICQENSLSSDMVVRYTPDVFDKLFPN